MKVKCTICGEVFDDSLGKCPVCGAGLDKCVPYVEGEGRVWATEHKVGEGASCGDAEIVEGLRANFNGECMEVGMYLAMARVADREGYPEVAEAYTRIAFEEAGHASRFAELLGECITDSTEENLRRRVEAEYGANSGKFDLAKRAKKLGFDAIHDSVHEMAKDEARHGKAFLGLLERYFENKK